MGIFIGANKSTPLGIDKAYVGNDLIYQSGPNIVAKLTPTAGVTYSTDISDWTPEDMKLISGTISNNADITSDTSIVYVDWDNRYYKLSCEQNVYTTKSMTLSGTSYLFTILGFNHDNLAIPEYYGKVTNTNKAGITWSMINTMTNSSNMNDTNTNVNGWEGCKMRTETISNIYSNFEYKNSCAPVIKQTSAGNTSSTIKTTTETLFLLSEIEIFGTLAQSFAGEGSQYKWYKNQNTKKKTIHNQTGFIYYWERSPGKANTLVFCYVTQNGTASSNGASNPYYPSYSFCS